MVPWLITTPAWPALAAHLAGPTARVVVEPFVTVGATVAAVTCACVLLLRRARARPVDPSSDAAQALSLIHI